MNTIDYNGIVLSVITPGSRVKFDCSALRSYVFRRYKHFYSGGGESLFPVAHRQYGSQEAFCADVRKVCKSAKVVCPPEFKKERS